MNRIALFILFFSLLACQEVYIPELDDSEDVLVIEASITTQVDDAAIKISMSRQFSESSSYDMISGATVSVIDEYGKATYFIESGEKGIYNMPSEPGYKARIGSIYTLRIETPDGLIYESLPQTVVESPPIDSLNCGYSEELVLYENVYGETLEEIKEGINIRSTTQGLLETGNYYQYDWEAYSTYYSFLYRGEARADCYCYFQLHKAYYSVIRTANADEFADHRLTNHQMVFVANEDNLLLGPVTPAINDYWFISSSFFNGLYFILKQKSISPDAYHFWFAVEEQLNASGRLFDPVAIQVKGNLKCVNDTTRQVIGAFSASDVSESYYYIYIDELTRDVYYVPVDTILSRKSTICYTFDKPLDWRFPPHLDENEFSLLNAITHFTYL